jgi:uncharacterized membrane protein
MAYIKMYLVAFVVFLAIDAVWLGVVAKNLYRTDLGFLMAEAPNWIAAVLFYLVFVVGLVFFVIHPALEKGSLAYAVFAGLLFGFVSYATYDLTNMATIAGWPFKITVIDLIWGSSLGGMVSGLSYLLLYRWL